MEKQGARRTERHLAAAGLGCLTDLSSAVLNAVRRLAADARERFGARLVSVRLFGSWARGESTIDSDVDVCVLVDGLTKAEKVELFDRATEIGWSTGWSISVLAMDTRDFEGLIALEAGLARDIEREGIAA